MGGGGFTFEPAAGRTGTGGSGAPAAGEGESLSTESCVSLRLRPDGAGESVPFARTSAVADASALPVAEARPFDAGATFGGATGAGGKSILLYTPHKSHTHTSTHAAHIQTHQRHIPTRSIIIIRGGGVAESE